MIAFHIFSSLSILVMEENIYYFKYMTGNTRSTYSAEKAEHVELNTSIQHIQLFQLNMLN